MSTIRPSLVCWPTSSCLPSASVTSRFGMSVRLLDAAEAGAGVAAPVRGVLREGVAGAAGRALGEVDGVDDAAGEVGAVAAADLVAALPGVERGERQVVSGLLRSDGVHASR